MVTLQPAGASFQPYPPEGDPGLGSRAMPMAESGGEDAGDPGDSLNFEIKLTEEIKLSEGQEKQIDVKQLQQKMERNKDLLLFQVKSFMSKQDELMNQLGQVLEATMQQFEAAPAEEPAASGKLVGVRKLEGGPPQSPLDSFTSPRQSPPLTPKKTIADGHRDQDRDTSAAAKSLGLDKLDKEKVRRTSSAVLGMEEEHPDWNLPTWLRCGSKLMLFLQGILYSKSFETISSLVIVANTVFMAYMADYQVGIAIEGGEEDVLISTIIEISFTTYYTVEILLRMVVLQWYFVVGKEWSWNSFDTILVCTAWYDVLQTLLGASGGGNLSFLRVMRLAKMLKLLRMIRLMRAFRELRLILNSVMSSVKSMFWAIMLILTVAFMFGLCFVQATTAYIKEHKATITEEQLATLDYRWGGVLKSIYTLYVASMGGNDWEIMSDTLRPLGVMFVYLFLLYIGFFFCVVTNTLTSLFVENAMTNADKDSEAVIQAELEQKDAYVKLLAAWYHALDDDDSGDITLIEFMAHAEEPSMMAFAAAMEINMTDVKQFFEVLSSNGRRPVDLETFVVGCIKLKGMAKAIDLIDLSYAHKAAHQDLRDLSEQASERHEEMQMRIENISKDVEGLRRSQAGREILSLA